MNQDDGQRQAEGYCDLGMWQQAFDTLENMPTEAKATVPALLLHVRILVGVGELDKALLLVSSVAHQVPESVEVEAAVCDVLITNAKAEAMAGRTERAKTFIRQCIALDPERRLEVLAARELDGIW